MRSHKPSQFGAMMVGAHEKVALVLVAARVAGSWLCCRCQSLEVELVSVTFTVHFRHYILVVVVSEIGIYCVQ